MILMESSERLYSPPCRIDRGSGLEERAWTRTPAVRRQSRILVRVSGPRILRSEVRVRSNKGPS